eukprot:scaffold21514_cov57-Phaeocystis_antarctica.AAC.1
MGSFSSCPRIPQSGQGGRAALWAALRADPGRPSARLGRPFGPPFGPPFFLKGGPRRPGRPGGPQGGPQALRAAPRPSGRPLRTRDVKPATVGSTAMASSKAVQLDSAALEFGGAWFAKQEVDVAGVERVDAHSAQVAHVSLLPR